MLPNSVPISLHSLSGGIWQQEGHADEALGNSLAAAVQGKPNSLLFCFLWRTFYFPGGHDVLWK